MKTNLESASSVMKACWTCAYQQIGGAAFLGRCTYFSVKLNQSNKAIPAYQVDKGCRYWEIRPVKSG